MDSLNGFAVFVQVAETRSFVAAGRLLGVSASAVGKSVARLEDRLGVRLIQRSTRRFSVTEAGQTFYSHVQAMLVEAEAAEEAVARSRAAPRGTLRVACPTALLHAQVGEMLAGFLLAHPQVTLQLDAGNRRVEVVGEGLDVAIRVRPPPLEDSDLVVRVLARRTWCVAASPALLAQVGSPQHPEALATLPTVDLAQAGATHAWTLIGPDDAVVRVEHVPRMASDDMLALRTAALSGVGIAMLPRMLLIDALAAGELVELLPGWASQPGIVHAVFPSRRGLLPAVRALLDHLAAGFAALEER